MALTSVTPDTPIMPVGRPVGGEASAVETINDSTSTAVPPATTTYTEHGLTMRSFTVVMGSSYPTGGEALTASTLGLTSLAAVICTPAAKSDFSDAYAIQYDHTNSKLMAYRDTASSAAFTQVPNTTNLSAYTCHLLAIGHP